MTQLRDRFDRAETSGLSKLLYLGRKPKGLTMPIYEYVCDDCQARFEKIVINKQQEIACPKCASKKATIQLSVFATAGNASSSSSSGSSSSGGGCCGGGCGCH